MAEVLEGFDEQMLHVVPPVAPTEVDEAAIRRQLRDQVARLEGELGALFCSTYPRTGFEWNYTTFLNIAFLAVFAVLYWLYRNRERLGGGQGYALDVVCGMQVRTVDAPASRHHDGETYWFCSDHCAGRFDREPASYKRPESGRR